MGEIPRFPVAGSTPQTDVGPGEYFLQWEGKGGAWPIGHPVLGQDQVRMDRAAQIMAVM